MAGIDWEAKQAQQDERRVKAYPAVGAAISGFHNLIVSVAGSFLGGTFIFLKDFAPHPPLWSLPFLFVGWLLLIACVFVVGLVRWWNIQNALEVYNDSYSDSKLEHKSVAWCKYALMFLGAGLLCLATFAAINVCCYGVTKEDKKQANYNESYSDRAGYIQETNPQPLLIRKVIA